MKTKVIIEVRGGNVEAIFSTEEIEYLIIDHDNLAAGDDLTDDFCSQDDIMSKEDMSMYVDGINMEYMISNRDDKEDDFENDDYRNNWLDNVN